MVEKISINPLKCRVTGNIIGNRHGYLESSEDFQSHKCEVVLNQSVSKAWKGFDVYSFKLKRNTSLVNGFSDDIAYCKPASQDSLYVCEHFNLPSDSYEDFFKPHNAAIDIESFRNGFKMIVKDEYLSNDKDSTSPFFLLIHQNDTGVEIPSNTNTITFSSTIDAAPEIDSILVGFVFFDKNHKLLADGDFFDIHNEGVGNEGRIKVTTSYIPASAKYVSIEFEFPNGVAKRLHTYENGLVEYINDYFSIELNCLLFNQNYGGFVRND